MPRPVPPPRICAWEGCTNETGDQRRKYCLLHVVLARIEARQLAALRASAAMKERHAEWRKTGENPTLTPEAQEKRRKTLAGRKR